MIFNFQHLCLESSRTLSTLWVLCYSLHVTTRSEFRKKSNGRIVVLMLDQSMCFTISPNYGPIFIMSGGKLFSSR